MIVQSSSDSRCATENPSIQVTAIYEDLEAGIRAKALMDCVQSGLDLPARLKVDLWRFDWLNELSMRNMALNIARNSTLVLVSASTNNPFPVETERWMRAWMQSRQAQLSAIVLLAMQATRAAGPHPLEDTLRRAAAHKQVEFYCEFFKPSHAQHGPVSPYRGGYDDRLLTPYERQRMVAPLISGGQSTPLAAASRAFQ
ncbi:MAG TPA: hypothetical protein VFZ59_13350 [Verrucomicrobiae bacterium]|nr:hypothetical protein [Verrucomicrobiae bacterium]